MEGKNTHIHTHRGAHILETLKDGALFQVEASKRPFMLSSEVKPTHSPGLKYREEERKKAKQKEKEKKKTGQKDSELEFCH